MKLIYFYIFAFHIVFVIPNTKIYSFNQLEDFICEEYEDILISVNHQRQFNIDLYSGHCAQVLNEYSFDTQPSKANDGFIVIGSVIKKFFYVRCFEADTCMVEKRLTSKKDPNVTSSIFKKITIIP